MLVGHGQSSPVNRPWPPGLQPTSAESPVLAPVDALQTFYMPPGYRIELVASEPLVQDPTVIDWDLEGRLWVVEMTGFVRSMDAPEPNHDRIGRVVVLEDVNGDGRMDRRTVFADGLILPRALKVLDRGVLVGEPGSLWFMRDTNRDLKADTKELVTNLYGRLHGSVEGNANSLLWAMDNWIHTAGADVFLRWKDGQFEVRRTLLRGEWGATQDDGGRIYRNTNESALHVDFVPTPYFARNPNLLRTRGSYDALRDDENLVNLVWPVRPNPGTNRAYQFGIDRADGTLERFTAVCAPLVYRGNRLPAELYGNVFVAEPAANLVGRIVLEDDGTTLRARKAYEVGRVPGVDRRAVPPGLSLECTRRHALHRGHVSRRDPGPFVHDDLSARLHPEEEARCAGRPGPHLPRRPRNHATGRDAGFADEDRADRSRADAGAPEWLASRNGAAADRGAIRGGQDRRGSDGRRECAVRRSREIRATGARASTRCGRSTASIASSPTLIINALDDKARDVRVAALRIAERWLGDANHPVQKAVIARLEDTDWAVRRQLAATLGALPPGAA